MAATKNRFFTDSSSIDLFAALQTGGKHGEFYQQLAQSLIKGFHTKESLIGVGQRLTALAQHAYTLRQMDNLEQASQILMDLPIAEYRSIGLYYYALAIKRHGQTTQAEALLERVADDAPIRYRGQALLSLGTFALISGSRESALRFYTEALRVASRKDLLITVQTLKMVAVVKGIEGDHRGAVADLERLLPAVHAARVYHPQFLYDYLNSLAVELGEVGRLEEAKNVSRIVLASPYISAYPEHRETWHEIQVRGYRASRSVVALTQGVLKTENLLRLPAPERSDSFRQADSSLDTPRQSARIFDLQAWKKKMVKEPNDPPQDDRPSKMLDDREKMLRIIQLISQSERTDQELENILEAIEKIVSKPKGKGKQ